jgi:hypothetical protein
MFSQTYNKTPKKAKFCLAFGIFGLSRNFSQSGLVWSFVKVAMKFFCSVRKKFLPLQPLYPTTQTGVTGFDSMMYKCV